ncbi:anhydro-N-acetylmuramic acid kinase [Herbihabitans rhizosphaerae]|uniref:Anhydro-N-acetylmuramic acid kinase n=2 Tax=Herbihabitans rhizosphaerae TaxID=1872711 RepID=A0A4Q7KSC9_9PSEU|nr:anhydro-N-acetylmuramic acid kinase [Herbihabitans rhizosphaerae]RZS39336.1 anhydro-N-acetylmuramic acid kinase [Herbihabitans rhizosphaerae]
MDGIDVAVGEMGLDGSEIILKPLWHKEIPYDPGLKAELLAALPPNSCDAATLCRLDTRVGQAFAAAATHALSRTNGPGGDLVASLGQTIYHWVEGGRALGTLQLGQPAWIAEATGLPVIADLRARDVAAGGHGAPLAAALDRLWLAGSAEPVAALNLGGIANITVIAPNGPDDTVLAYDTGPANALLDAASRLIGGPGIDQGGALAAVGSVRQDLLDVLLADPYYAAPPPKSTGKEHFHRGYLTDVLADLPEVGDADLMATLAELTARTVAGACLSHGVRRVVASGGGVHNSAMMAAIATHLGDAELITSDELGLPSSGKEAYLAALLGFLTWQGIPANCPPATGAEGPRLLGSVTPGTAPLAMPRPSTSAVTRLRIADLVPATVGGASAHP